MRDIPNIPKCIWVFIFDSIQEYNIHPASLICSYFNQGEFSDRFQFKNISKTAILTQVAHYIFKRVSLPLIFSAWRNSQSKAHMTRNYIQRIFIFISNFSFFLKQEAFFMLDLYHVLFSAHSIFSLSAKRMWHTISSWSQWKKRWTAYIKRKYFWWLIE